MPADDQRHAGRDHRGDDQRLDQRADQITGKNLGCGQRRHQRIDDISRILAEMMLDEVLAKAFWITVIIRMPGPRNTR